MYREEETRFHTIAGQVLDVIATFQRWPMARRLALAIAIVVAGMVIRFTLLGPIGTGPAYVTLYPAVTIAALVSGLYGGVLATITAAGLAHRLVTPLHDAGDFFGLATFLVSGLP